MSRSSIFDPAKEERRVWEAKKRDLNPKRIRTADMFLCHYCGIPISPDALMCDLGGERACVACVKKERDRAREGEHSNGNP